MSAALASSLLVSACGSSVPRPPRVQVVQTDYVPVTAAPRVVRVEIVPEIPRPDAVWVDGSWQWVSGEWAWHPGGWVVPPPGARYASWVLVRRHADGQLFFAPSKWVDAAGRTIPEPPVVAVARTRPDE